MWLGYLSFILSEERLYLLGLVICHSFFQERFILIWFGYLPFILSEEVYFHLVWLFAIYTVRGGFVLLWFGYLPYMLFVFIWFGYVLSAIHILVLAAILTHLSHLCSIFAIVGKGVCVCVWGGGIGISESDDMWIKKTLSNQMFSEEERVGDYRRKQKVQEAGGWVSGHITWWQSLCRFHGYDYGAAGCEATFDVSSLQRLGFTQR